MEIENDLAVEQEGTPEGTTTSTEPSAVEEADAESSTEAVEEGAEPQKDQKAESTEEVEIVVDGEEPPSAKEHAPAWVRDLRKEHRDLKAENAELKRQAQAREQSTVVDPGPKPTLEDPDVEFDREVFEKKYDVWHARKQQQESQMAKSTQEAAVREAEWRKTLGDYEQARQDMAKRMPGFLDAEVAVQSVLSQHQQGIILHVSEANAPLVVAALGSHPELLKDLAAEKDSARFIAKIAKLEVRLKTQKKSQVPPPEKPVRGSGAVSGAVDSQLERLRTEAAKTGNFSKVAEYNRKKRAQS